MEWYEKLHADKNARIVRNLCMIRTALELNYVRDILDEACRATRADMTTAEKNQFYDKYIKTMHVDISPNGEATIVLGK